jgi:WhiB family redox-sensing transcriptional regulator
VAGDVVTALAFTPPPFLVDDAEPLCAETDPEAFFPDQGGSSRDAIRTCNRCELRDPCLAYALRDPRLFGVWGGTTERRRRQLRHDTKAAAA